MQTGMFGGPRGHEDGRVEIPLAEAAPLVLWKGWLADHAELLPQLVDTLPWEQHHLGTPVGPVAAPRLECWFSSVDGAQYTYSGETYTATPIAGYPVIERLRAEVSAVTGIDWDALFVNLYRTGQDSISWHDDSEEEALGPAEEIQIASLSLGVRRPFNLKGKREPSSLELVSGVKVERVTVQLGLGDLLLMGPRSQSAYLHSVPKRPEIRDPRVNLTFRKLAPRRQRDLFRER